MWYDPVVLVLPYLECPFTLGDPEYVNCHKDTGKMELHTLQKECGNKCTCCLHTFRTAPPQQDLVYSSSGRWS